MKIPITLITGFLGGGKTTFINDVLKNRKDLNVGLIVNEFGDAKIESSVIEKSNEDIIELNNGCMCCVVRSDIEDSINKLLESKKDINYILVEASGLSSPIPIINTLMSGSLREKLRLDSVICVVDCLNFEKTNNFITLITQLMSSNFVLLTKSELVEEEKLEDIKELVKEINKNAKIFVKDKNCFNELLDKSVLDPSILENLEKEAIHDKEKFDHLIFKTDKLIDFQKFNEYFTNIKYDLIRAKGFFRFYEDSELDKKYVFQLVGSHKYLTDKDWGETEEKQTALVLIGKKLYKEKLKEDLNKLLIS